MILLFILISELVLINAFDYCKITCDGKKHTMCEYPAGGGEACKGYKTGLTSQQQQLILDMHNNKRQLVAKGLEVSGPQPQAADMMELTWDTEMATIAQRWADQCKVKAIDGCRTTSNNIYTGQNSYILFTKNLPLTLDRVIKNTIYSWYSQVKHVPPTLVKRFEFLKNFNETSHYTQMVWGRTQRIGCGMSYTEEGNGNGSYKVVCNYQMGGNIMSEPIYRVGKPCSACPKGSSCSKQYPALCQAHRPKSN